MDAAYAELFTRWYQFGVFNPMFRVHGTSHPKEIWQFPPDTQKILLAYDRLRYRLLPYIYSLSWDVTHNQGTMMRPLAMDFQDDAKAASIGDQYMFGKALLVSPVLEKGATTRAVYLPGHSPWYDFWSGARMAGGQTVSANAGIATIPVFARAGSILPLGPVVQYADEKSSEPTELRVYPGANGAFDLYDDAGDGYAYQARQFAVVRITWNEAKRTLTLAKRQGSFPGMATQRVFVVTCGRTGVSQASQRVRYIGQPATVRLARCR
jgi:alpha-D-xyloside xylohydrolase